jgi:hypothetical protein
MNVLPNAPLTDAGADAIAALQRWHGPVEIVQGASLTGVDFVLVMPGGNADLEARARRAGVRIMEVCGEDV